MSSEYDIQTSNRTDRLNGLLWKKVLGCYTYFGLREVARRSLREVLRPLRAREALDISPVTEYLAIGAAPRDQKALYGLRSSGYKKIIDLRQERKVTDVLTRTEELVVKWVPTLDDWQPKSGQFFSRLEQEIKSSFEPPDQERLFICCGAGEHRAPLAGVLALVVAGYDVDQAVRMILKARSVAELLPPYLESLDDYLHGQTN